MRQLILDPARGTVRLLRGAVVGTAGTAVSVLAHLAAGGQAPGSLPFGAASVIGVAVCWWLSERRWTTRRLLGALLLVQSGLHLTLTTQAGAYGSTAVMLGAHLAATLVAARLLRSGESWLWELMDTLALRTPALVRVRPLPVPARTATMGGAVTRPVGCDRTTPWRRRGPPLNLSTC